MRAFLWAPFVTCAAALLLVWPSSQQASAQSIMSPFVVLCRNTCGGYGLFRRLCCMVDSVCCSKPDACPEDTLADTLIPFCQSCTEDVDCLFRSKCCDSEGRKCCTAIRSSMFRNSVHQRAKKKKDTAGSAITTSVTNTTDTKLVEDSDGDEQHDSPHLS